MTGRRLVETRTSEIATNVTADQIENLPQGNRNFLNFARAGAWDPLCPRANCARPSAAAVSATTRTANRFGGPQVNVFIDGVSLKSNVHQGGVVGQDVSARQSLLSAGRAEFRVLTSNFKAEYEDAGTAIITAVDQVRHQRVPRRGFRPFQTSR